MIFAVTLCYLSGSQGKTWKFRPARDSNPDLCDAGAVRHLLSYQANQKLVTMKVYDAPVDNGYMRFN